MRSIIWGFSQQLSHHKSSHFGSRVVTNHSCNKSHIFLNIWIFGGFQNGINSLEVGKTLHASHLYAEIAEGQSMQVVWHRSWFLTECGRFWSSSFGTFSVFIWAELAKCLKQSQTWISVSIHVYIAGNWLAEHLEGGVDASPRQSLHTIQVREKITSINQKHQY